MLACKIISKRQTYTGKTVKNILNRKCEIGLGVSGRRAAAGAPLKILRRRRQKLNGALPPPINKGRRAAAEQMALVRTSTCYYSPTNATNSSAFVV
jgi:hypothetical protein